MSLTTGSIRIGTASANSIHAADLGKTIEVNGKRYRMCKAVAAITAAANKVLSTAVTAGGVPTHIVNTTTTAGDQLVAGVVPAGQTGSSGTTGLLLGDYFYIQIAGDCTPLIHTTATAAGSGIAASTTAGSADAISGTFAATTPGSCFGFLLAASSGADAATAARINIG